MMRMHGVNGEHVGHPGDATSTTVVRARGSDDGSIEPPSQIRCPIDGSRRAEKNQGSVNGRCLLSVGRAMDRPAPAFVEPQPASGNRASGMAAESEFEDLFAAEHEQLFRALYLITGSSQESEELMQDAFLKVWERWDRIRVMENPAGYVCRVAVNGARSRSRRLAIAARRTLPFTASEDAFAAADLRDELVRALKTLTPRQRMALVMTDLLGFSSDEAADVLGVTAGTVRALASHGRAALRIEMEDDDA